MDTKKKAKVSRNAGYERLISEVEKEDKQKLEQKAFESGVPVAFYIRKAVKEIVKDVRLPKRDSNFE